MSTDFELFRVHQPVRRSRLTDDELTARLHKQLRILPIRTGSRVALGVGSRGIDRLPLVVSTTVAALRARGAEVFIFPAMGSHGGGTGTGQAAVLAALGVDERSAGCPIRSDMTTVQLGETSAGIPVHLDAHAATADHIMVINRIKPHTHFRGAVESGLSKMLVIGAGKHEQALLLHAHGVRGLRDHIPEVAKALVATGRVLAGIALVEDGAHQLSAVEVVAGSEIPTREPKILDAARAFCPRLPTDDIDLLIVDRIGKDISGTGMDTNVIGRVRALDFAAFDRPTIRVIYARSLTEATHGNAIGMGLADLVHRRLADAVDPVATRINAMTGGSPEQGAMPIIAPSDRNALSFYDIFLRGPKTMAQSRIVWIQDTLHLEDMFVSAPLIPEIESLSGTEVTGLGSLQFDERGDFTGDLWGPATGEVDLVASARDSY